MSRLSSAAAVPFRTDINGLRAWAVMAVVLYHFGVPGFAGGFLGVDVFFVISGFLMTGILVKGHDNGGFSIFSFYLARARRILPALAALCAVLLLVGAVALPAQDYKALAQQAAYSMVFLSNAKFWMEAGYFDASSHEKWLLHTWSLSVEWQFYLLLPLVLAAVWRWRRGGTWLPAVLIAGTLLSFLLSVVVTPLNPSAAFYLLPMRAWEMLAGGLIFLLGRPGWLRPGRARLLEVVGFLLIVLPLVGLDGESSWPGWRAAFPVAGTAAVILAARTGSLWTSTRLMQWLGDNSYSIYLWHWPVVVVLTHAGQQGRPLAVAAGIALALVLGHLSFRLVEVPSRRHLARGGTRRATVTLLTVALGVAGTGLAVRLLGGLPQRLPAQVHMVDAESANRNRQQEACVRNAGATFTPCRYGGANTRLLVLGDSHGIATVTAAQAALPGSDDGLMAYLYEACPSLFGVKRIDNLNRCSDFNDWAFAAIRQYPPEVPLLIVNRTSNYAYGRNEDRGSRTARPLVYFTERHHEADPVFLQEFSRHIVESACRYAAERPVYLLRPIPEIGANVPKVMARNLMWNTARPVSVSLDEYRERNAVVRAAQDEAALRCGVHLLDPEPYLCREGRCDGGRDGRPVYFDDDHLSESGNRLLVPLFASVFTPGNTGRLSAHPAGAAPDAL